MNLLQVLFKCAATLLGAAAMTIGCSSAFGQPQAQTWYFGNGAGIDFSGSTPKPLDNSEMFTDEGCSSISDATGNLLFYTDGISVWNADHKVMVGGDALNGHKSATQSALIAPKPGTQDIYYIFTVGEKADNHGLCYSEVDMSNGKGAVTRKNKPLLRSTTEKLIAVPHAQAGSYWVIAHQWNSSALFAYPVSREGIGKPVVSNIGQLHKDIGSGNNGEAIGQIAATQDGSKLAMVQTYSSGKNLELMDFDPATGVASNAQAHRTEAQPYGVAFSPDGTKLYVSFLTGKKGIMQFDANSANLTQTATNITFHSGVAFGSMALGPDGRLYIARTESYIDAIGNPNAKGLDCNYLPAFVKFSYRYSAYGLPNALWKFSDLVEEQPLAHTPPPPAKPKVPTPVQPVKEPAAETANTASKLNISLGPDTSLCAKDYLLNPGVPDATYKWSNGAKSPTLKAFSSGYYAVTVTKNGEQATASVNLKFIGEPVNFNYLPVFRPGQALNNRFDFTLRNVTDFKLTIWNKRGKIVYESTNIAERWKGTGANGKELPSGVYTWEFQYRPQCPTTDLVTKKGTVEMVRASK